MHRYQFFQNFALRFLEKINYTEIFISEGVDVYIMLGICFKKYKINTEDRETGGESRGPPVLDRGLTCPERVSCSREWPQVGNCWGWWVLGMWEFVRCPPCLCMCLRFSVTESISLPFETYSNCPSFQGLRTFFGMND